MVKYDLGGMFSRVPTPFPIRVNRAALKISFNLIYS